MHQFLQNILGPNTPRLLLFTNCLCIKVPFKKSSAEKVYKFILKFKYVKIYFTYWSSSTRVKIKFGIAVVAFYFKCRLWLCSLCLFHLCVYDLRLMLYFMYMYVMWMSQLQIGIIWTISIYNNKFLITSCMDIYLKNLYFFVN